MFLILEVTSFPILLASALPFASALTHRLPTSPLALTQRPPGLEGQVNSSLILLGTGHSASMPRYKLLCRDKQKCLGQGKLWLLLELPLRQRLLKEPGSTPITRSIRQAALVPAPVLT